MKTDKTQSPLIPPHLDDYDDGNIPEIDLPGSMDASNTIPDEVPRKDGPGGE